MPIIKTINLSRTYSKKDIEVNALNSASIEIHEGEFVSIVGKSGSGKSTLMNLIGGLDTPTQGEIFFNGEKLNGMTRKQLALHRRFSVGMIFQSFNLIPTRNALENIKLPLILAGIPRNIQNKKAIELIEMVGLSGRHKHYPGELSGGESQRVAIARALANSPKVLLADEPTGNLDSVTSEEIIGHLSGLNRGKGLTVLMVTHDLETAEKVSDKIIQLADGKIVNILTK
ncbi:MAG: ABC transporter ATP-binding protein [Prolixibacteraceae bacterium]|nr:ABC transporter ATP-binding protein [Prolixibacteraceae bacterium]MBN2773582.1 ABC transporter ATP-binding protein [Prolixibacteraceae bacterium]